MATQFLTAADGKLIRKSGFRTSASLPLTDVQALVQMDRYRCAVILQSTAVVVFCDNVWMLRSLISLATSSKEQWDEIRERKVVEHPDINFKAARMSRYMIQKKVSIASDLIVLFLRTGVIELDNNSK